MRRRGVVLGGALFLLAALPAAAAEIAVPTEVRAGTLALRLPAGPLDTFQVADATGSGAGWRVSAAVVGGTGGAAVTGVRVRTLAGSAPANDVAYPVTLAANQPVRIASAAPGTGMGTSELAPVFELAGTEPVSLELTLTAGP